MEILGQNSIVIAPGANMECLTPRIDELERVVAIAKLVLCQNETTPESVRGIFELARKHNGLIIVTINDHIQ